MGGMPPGNTCNPGIDCAAETDPFVLAMLDTCNGVTVSRASSPVALEGAGTQGTADHAVVDKWVDGYRQVWELDNNFSSGKFQGWTGTDQTNDLMSNYRATIFFRDSNPSELTMAATDPTGTIWEFPDNFAVTASSPVQAAGSPSGYVRHDGLNTVDFRGTDGNIYEAFWDGPQNGWLISSQFPISAQTNFPANGDPMGFRRSSKSSSIIFACNSQICEERLTSSGWGFRALATAVRMAPFVPAPLATPDAKWVTFYVGEDGLREIVDACDPDPTFSCKPSESLIYASQNIVSAPAPYVDQNGGVSVVVITDSNGANPSQVVQVSRAKTGTSWTASTLYTASKSSETLVGDPAAYLATAINANTILFRSSAFATHELQWSSSQNKYVSSTISF